MMRSVIIILVIVSFSEEQRNNKGGGKIIGGINVNISDYPYQVALLYDNVHDCGGSIISPDWILTAAHCVFKPIEQYSVRVGSTYRHTGGELHSIANVVIHEKYSELNLDYDIALLQLSRSITAENTQVIQLPSPGTGPNDGMTVVVTGWGRIAEGGFGSDVLQMVKLSVVNHNYCNSIYSNGITERMFCAGNRTGLHGACYGDSGGPAVIEGIQYGVASWVATAACASADRPNGFANVAFLRNWIDASCVVST